VNNTITQQTVELISNDGSSIGTIFVPDNLAGTSNSFVLNVDFGTNIPFIFNGVLGSAIIDITLLDSSGKEITELNEPLEICLFSQDERDNEDTCLSFFNTNTQEWECEDECLEKNENGLLCGETSNNSLIFISLLFYLLCFRSFNFFCTSSSRK